MNQTSANVKIAQIFVLEYGFSEWSKVNYKVQKPGRLSKYRVMKITLC